MFTRVGIKIIAQLILITSLVVSTLGCERFLKSNKSSEDSLVVKMRPKEFSCLTTWSDNVKKYFHDELSEEETLSVFTCLDKSIAVFKTFTRGQSANEYTDTELKDFLNRYLMKDRQMTTNFMTQIMKLKVFLLGGSISTITASEFQNIHNVITIFSDEAVQLRGYWRVLLLTQEREKVMVEDLAVANTLAKSSLLRIIAQSHATSSQYSFSDVRSLIDEATTFMNSTKTLANLTKWLTLADSIRHLFVGDSSDNLSQADWFSLARWSTDAYGLMLSYYYHMVNISVNVSESWKQIFSFIDRSLSLLESSPQMQKRGILTVQGIDNVIDELGNTKALPLSMTTTTLKDTYRHIFASMIQSKRLGQTAWQYVKGLEKQDLETIQQEYQIWKLAQTALVQVFQKRSTMKFDDMKLELSKLPIPNLIDKAKISSADKGALQVTWDEWLALISSNYPLALDTNLRITIPTYATGKTVSLSSMSLLNGVRTLVRSVLVGYGVQRNSNPWQSVMTQTGMANWETDFRNFGIEIKFLDKRDPGAGVRVFSEARYFTFSSVGGYELSSQQMMESLSLMISGGMGAAHDMMALLELENVDCKVKKTGTNEFETDSGFDRHIFTETCFDRMFLKNFAQIFENLPALNREISSGRQGVGQILELLKQIAFRKSKIAGSVEYSEIRTIGGVMHYLEALFETFDTNRNEYLDMNEVLAAYPRFSAVVADVSPLGTFLEEDAFLYVVYKGQKPKVDGIISGISAAAEFTYFVAQRNLNNLGEVPRTNLLKVITLLKQK